MAGATQNTKQMDDLSRVLNGYVFSSLTMPGADNPAGLVDRLLHAFFDA